MNSARFKIRKVSKQFRPVANCAPPLAWLPNWPLAIKQAVHRLFIVRVHKKTHRGIEPRRALFFWSASLYVAAREAAREAACFAAAAATFGVFPRLEVTDFCF